MARFIVPLVMLLSFLFINDVKADDDWFSQLKDLVNSQENSQLTESDIISGLKETLSNSTQLVVNQLANKGGFTKDPKIHIPLPGNLKKVIKVLSKVGFDTWGNELEAKINLAAEQATPKAKILFINAINNMNFEDLESIYKGENDAATQYFKEVLSESLRAAFTPIVNASLDDVGAIKIYSQMIDKYDSLPFAPNIKNNLSAHVVEKTLYGIFYYVAVEEKAIRQNPMKQTSDLLKKLFGKP